MRRLSFACAAMLVAYLMTVAVQIGGPGPTDAAAATPVRPLQSPALLPVVSDSKLGKSVGPAVGFVDDLKAAITAVNDYWSAHWSDFFTGSYTPPRLNVETFGLYDGHSPDAPTCGGSKLEAENAFYCIPEDFLAWDVTLMRDGYAKGDSWVYLVVGHEWGHAIQARLDESSQDVARELQADCLAGGVLYGAAADGTLQMEIGDDKEIVHGLTDLADQTPWTSSADHGDAFERVNAFNLGRVNGVDGCFRTS